LYTQHDVHAVLVTALGLASLLQLGSGGGGGGGGSVDSRGVGWVHEMHVWTFSATYFCVDTVDAVRGRRWQMVVAHHSPSLALFVSNLLYPRIMELFYVSRILIIEVSTPLLTRCECADMVTGGSLSLSLSLSLSATRYRGEGGLTLRGGGAGVQGAELVGAHTSCSSCWCSSWCECCT
jgi:hypothetical protein